MNYSIPRSAPQAGAPGEDGAEASTRHPPDDRDALRRERLPKGLLLAARIQNRERR